jgi:hypothetical protein
LRLLLLLIALIAAGCAAPRAAEPPPDPLTLITESASRIRDVDTFRITVAQTGPNYNMYTEYATVVFRMATGQYVAPDVMQATVRVLAAGLPITVDVYAKGADQWYRAIWTGNTWLNAIFQPTFNPAELIAGETGFQSALDALLDLEYVGATTLESGVEAQRIDATADGSKVTALLGGLIAPVGEVEVEVYIGRENGLPVRFVVREFDSPFAAPPRAGQEAEPVTWLIDLYDFNAPARLDVPEGAS